MRNRFYELGVAILVAMGLWGWIMSNLYPTTPPDTECPPPMTVGCESDREPAAMPSSKGRNVGGDEDGYGGDEDGSQGFPGKDKHPNAGHGNGSEGDPDKDPGNSEGHNKGDD